MLVSKEMDFECKKSQFINDRRYINNVVDIINATRGLDALAACKAIEDIFATVMERGDLHLDPNVIDPKALEIEQKYIDGLLLLYEEAWKKFLLNLSELDGDCQVKIVQSSMVLLASERKHISTQGKFPVQHLTELLRCLLASEKTASGLNKFIEYTSYQDIFFYTWKALKIVMVKRETVCVKNTLALLEKLVPTSTIQEGETLCFCDKTNFVYRENMVKGWIQQVWMRFINCDLTPTDHRHLLILLLEKYLSNLKIPTLLTDFFMNSMALNGAISLLALQGMSTLVLKHNLECPNIYEKLYNMFQIEILHSKYKTRLFYLSDLFRWECPNIYEKLYNMFQIEILHSKYKTRLFYLSDLFLQSTHISEHMVAAFIKRLSRLSLQAQAPDLVVILQFIGNLLIRHPSLQLLIRHPTGGEVECDPYLMDEADPLKSRAMESSLWELALLKNHIQPRVAIAAKFIDSPLPTVEWDLRDVLEGSYAKMFDTEIKKNPKAEPSLTFIRPSSLQQSKDDYVYKMWSLT